MKTRLSALGTSVGAHHAVPEPPASGTSVGDLVVAFMSYNIGLQNAEIRSPNMYKPGQKYDKLKADISSAFSSDHAIQVLLISEFCNMFQTIDAELRSSGLGACPATNTKVFFEQLLQQIDLVDANSIVVVANAPYVALVNSRYWNIMKHQLQNALCSK